MAQSPQITTNQGVAGVGAILIGSPNVEQALTSQSIIAPFSWKPGATQGINEYELMPQTVTTSGQTSGILNDLGPNIGAVLTVTALTGTLPTLDVTLQLSFDTGVTWRDLYHFERQTSVAGGFGGGVAVMPAIPINGSRRWVWTLGGTGSPSATFSIDATGTQAEVPEIRQFYDRTPALLNGTAFAVSNTYAIQGLTELIVVACIGVATKAASYQIQMSLDGINFYFAGNLTVAANATTVIPISAGLMGHYIRIACSGAATAQTGNYIGILGWGT